MNLHFKCHPLFNAKIKLLWRSNYYDDGSLISMTRRCIWCGSGWSFTLLLKEMLLSAVNFMSTALLKCSFIGRGYFKCQEYWSLSVSVRFLSLHHKIRRRWSGAGKCRCRPVERGLPSANLERLKRKCVGVMESLGAQPLEPSCIRLPR